MVEFPDCRFAYMETGLRMAAIGVYSCMMAVIWVAHPVM